MRLPRFITRHHSIFTLLLGVGFAISSGCTARSLLDPTEMGAYPRSPLIVPILENLDTGYAEGDERFVNATNIRPSDLETVSQDYVISKNDLLTIAIEGLVAPGHEYFKQVRVSETGNISLPYIGPIKASGLTEGQLEQSITKTYQDMNLIEGAQVSVTTVEARGRTFTIVGNVPIPGQYAIFDTNFRLLDAMALSRGVASQGVETIYVVRRIDQEPAAREFAPDLPEGPATEPSPDDLVPESKAPNPRTDAVARTKPGSTRVALMKTQAQDQPANPRPAQPERSEGAEGRIVIIDGKPVQVDGEPVEMQPAEPEPMEDLPASDEAGRDSFEFNDLDEPNDVRVIRIPYERLQRGELRYNIVIRPQDMIIVPDPVIGEYYMGGHVGRVGVYGLTARKLTLKQAIIGAGMLDQIAVPWNTQVTRRIGPNQEITVRVDLRKIFAGQEPDFYLKPYDQVIVGTDFWAPWFAALRNGFRITYGFGFLYDRNYAADRGQRF